MDLTTHQPDKMTSKVERLAAMVDDKTLISTLIRENSDRIKLIEFKDARADIWQHFRLVQLDGTTLAYAVCTRCLKPVSYKAREGTGGLHRHPCSKAAAAAAASIGSTMTSINSQNGINCNPVSSLPTSHLLNLSANGSTESKLSTNRSEGVQLGNLTTSSSTSLLGVPPNHVIKGETFSDKDSFSSSNSPPPPCPLSPNPLSLVRSSTSTTRTPSPSVHQSPASSSSSPPSLHTNSSNAVLNSLFSQQASLMSANLINSFVMNHLASQQAAAMAASAFNHRPATSNSAPSNSHSADHSLNATCSSSTATSNKITSSSNGQPSPSNSVLNSAIANGTFGNFAYANGSVRSDCHAMVMLADSKCPPFTPIPESMTDLYERNILLDLTLICRNGSLRVHKLPLAAASIVLEEALSSTDAMMSHQGSCPSKCPASEQTMTSKCESESSKVNYYGGNSSHNKHNSPCESSSLNLVHCKPVDHLDLKEYDVSTLRSVIEYIYYGELNYESDGVLCEILRFADVYELKSLKFTCAQRLYSQLSPENAIEYLGIAENCNCDELKSLIPLFIAENASKVTSSNSWKETFRDRSDLVANLLSVTASELTIIAAAANMASASSNSCTASASASSSSSSASSISNLHPSSSSPIPFGSNAIGSSQLLHQLQSLINAKNESSGSKKRKSEA